MILVRDNARQGVHNQELMDDAGAWELSDATPVYGHLEGHFPAYTMVTYQRKEIRSINLHFHVFYNQNVFRKP